MSLRSEIADFIDGNGLVTPGPTSGHGRGSDNGPMFSSEYFVMLKKIGDLHQADIDQFNKVIGACVTSDGLLNRAPVGTDPDQEGPDDYYGVLHGCLQMGNTSIPRKMLWAVVKYLGFLNNNEPGKKTGASFLVRQPQMIAAMISAAFPSWLNPLHWLMRGLASPFYLVAAATIFISCINAPASDTDARRLSWHLVHTVVPYSLLCALASSFWWHRLYSVYGKLGMRGVAAKYYSPTHPFIKYWQD